MLRPGTFAFTALLAALTAIGPLSTDMYLPSLPDISHSLQAGTSQAQLTISVYLIGFAAGQIVYGPFSDRFGRRPVMLCALLIYGIGGLCCLLSPTIEVLLAARVVQALGSAGANVVARAIVRDMYSGARAGRELSVIGSVMALAPVLAPILGGALQTFFGWRSNFVALSAAGFVLAIFVWRSMPETLPRRSEETISLRSILQSYRIVARNRAFLAYVGIAALSFAGLFAWISGSSFVLQYHYRLTPFDFGVAFAMSAVGYMTGTSIAARLVIRLGLNRTIGVGAAALAAGGLCFVAVVALDLSSAVWLIAAIALYLAGLGMVLPQSFAGSMTPFPERAGAASSLLGIIQQGAAATTGAVVGIFLGRSDSAWPLAIAIAAAGCLTLAVWSMSRRVRGSGEGYAPSAPAE